MKPIRHTYRFITYVIQIVVSMCMVFNWSIKSHAQYVSQLNESELLQRAAGYCAARYHDPAACDLMMKAAAIFNIPSLYDYVILLNKRDLDRGYRLQQKVVAQLLQEATQRFGEASETAIRCRRDLVETTWNTDLSNAVQLATDNRLHAHQLFLADTTQWKHQQLYLLCRMEEMILLHVHQGDNPLHYTEILQMEQCIDSLYSIHPEDSEDKLYIYNAMSTLKPSYGYYVDYFNYEYNKQFPNGARLRADTLTTGLITNAPAYYEETFRLACKLFGKDDIRTLEVQSNLYFYNFFVLSHTDAFSFIDLVQLENRLLSILPKEDPTLLSHRFLMLCYQFQNSWDSSADERLSEYLNATKQFYGSSSRHYKNAHWGTINLLSRADPSKARAYIEELLLMCNRPQDKDVPFNTILRAQLTYYMEENRDPSVRKEYASNLTQEFLSYANKTNQRTWQMVEAANLLLTLCADNNMAEEVRLLADCYLASVNGLAQSNWNVSLYARFYVAYLLVNVQAYETAEQLLLDGVNYAVNMDDLSILYNAFVSKISSLYIDNLHDYDKAEILFSNQMDLLQQQNSLIAREKRIHLLWEQIRLIQSKTGVFTDWLPLLLRIGDECMQALTQTKELNFSINTFTNTFFRIFYELLSIRIRTDVQINHIDPSLETRFSEELNRYDNRLLQYETLLKEFIEDPRSNFQTDDYMKQRLLECSTAMELSVRKDTCKAEEYMLQGLAFNNPDLRCTALRDIVDFYVRTEDYSMVVQYGRELEELVRNYPPLINRINPVDIASELCLALYKSGQYEQALPYARKAYQLKQELLQLNVNLMTAEERENYIHTNGGHGNLMLKFLITHCPQELAAEVYQSILTEKGYLLRATERLQAAIRDSKNPKLQQLHDDIMRLKDHMQNKQSIESIQKDPKYALETYKQTVEIQKLERNLNRMVESLGITHIDTISWRDIQNRLDTNDVAIEFLFSEHNLGALILRKDDVQPQYVQLCESESLMKNIQEISRLGSQSKAEALYRNDSLHLYTRIWEPILSKLTGVKRIYFSPSGILNTLSLAAIRCPDGTYMLDRYTMCQLTTTGEIARKDSSTTPTDSTFVFYGACYYSPKHQEEDELFQSLRAVPQKEFKQKIQEWTSDSGHFYFLPSTRREVEDISEYIQQKRLSIHTLFGHQGTESSLRNFSGHSPLVMHLATHGFLMQSSDQFNQNGYFSQFPNARFSSMMCTGIALTGANQTWKQGNPDFENDGILTAHEISQLDLTGTRLIVLSACETGIGENSDEGVYGIYRGFKQAGVSSLLVSLWNVSDRSTAAFMRAFYRNWLTGKKSMQEAHRLAMQEIRVKNPSPYYWAPFVLLDSL